MNTVGAQRRKNLRVAWRYETVLRVVDENRTIRVVTLNVSVQGLLLFADEMLEPGTKIQVALDLPGPGSSPQEKAWKVDIGGEVSRWVGDNTMSIVFDRISPFS